MEKTISTSYGGVNSTVGELLVNRLIPNRYIQAVGPFIFLDHVYPIVQQPGKPQPPKGEFAHPHRGITTLSYVFSGGLEHFDSRGHHGIVSAGGLQWMKAGNGIIHDEQISPALREQGGTLHALQFWINLPAIDKAGDPEYMAIPSEQVPEVTLPDNAGVLRVLVGSMGDTISPLKTFSPQFLYHIRLRPKSTFTLEATPGFEYAAFVPDSAISVNGTRYGDSELIVFSDEGTTITLSNTCITDSDILLFGGAPYQEPIVAQGPFVMNTHAEISTAYKDFFSGKYGTIEYPA